jgi:hypothetical protein
MRVGRRRMARVSLLILELGSLNVFKNSESGTSVRDHGGRPILAPARN